MTNNQVLLAVDVVGALPMGDLTYSPSLMLIHANLQQIAAEVEEQRRNLVADARKGAEVPDNFDERLAKYEARIRKKAEAADAEAGDPAEAADATEAETEDADDAEVAAIHEKLLALFVPAYSEVLRQEAKLRFRLLTPDQFAALYAAVKAGPEELTVGNNKMSADEALSMVAGLLVA